MERSESIDELAKALAAFNLEVENPPADQSANIKHKTGGQHTITYADLAGITSATRKPLAKQGLSATQEILERNGMIGAATTILHSSGQWLTFAPVWIPAGDNAKDIGAAVTYSRRYSLSPALNLAPEYDGDAPNTRRPQPPPAPRREISAAEYDAVRTKWRTKGKSDDWAAGLLMKGNYVGPLEFMPRKAFEFLDEGLDKLPDVADPVSGEVAAQEPGDIASAPEVEFAPTDTDEATDDEVPGMDAEEFNATRERQAQEQDDERIC